MKKLFAVSLIAVLIFCVCGCHYTSIDGQNYTPHIEQKESESYIEQNETEATNQEIKNGDTIVTKNMEITINSVELTYDVLPDDTSSFYTHYEADIGEVYISVDADVKNLAKQNLSCDDIGRVTANYNDGYIYKGFVVVDDSVTGFTYALISDIEPLGIQGIKWLIECPQEVDETTYPLFLEFIIDGNTFVYNIR